LYPNLNNQRGVFNQGEQHNHFRLFLGDDIVSLLNKLLVFSKSKGYTSIVLSDESLLMHGMIETVLDALRDFSQQNADSVVLKVICYFRRHDHWIESAWKQWGLRQYSSIQEYIEERNQRFIDATISNFHRWEALVGRENVIVRVYEKDQMKGGILVNFLNILGIEYKPDKWKQVEKTNKAVNVGFSREVLEILALCKPLYSSAHDNILLNTFYELLGEEFQKKPFENYDLLSPVERLGLLEGFSDFYKTLAVDFLEREDGKLFYEPYPDKHDAYMPYQGLTLEKVVPVLMQAILTQHAQIQNLNGKIQTIEKERKEIHLTSHRFQRTTDKIQVVALKIKYLFTLAKFMLKLKKIKYFLKTPKVFDAGWYRRSNPDLSNWKISCYAHYLMHGWQEGRNPCPDFNVPWYLRKYPDVKQAGFEPLSHFMVIGWKEGKNPNPKFNTKKYLRNHPELKKSGINPLVHYLERGNRK
jgi:hypothetical protein